MKSALIILLNFVAAGNASAIQPDEPLVVSVGLLNTTQSTVVRRHMRRQGFNNYKSKKQGSGMPV
jgi:hypothetical protein